MPGSRRKVAFVIMKNSMLPPIRVVIAGIAIAILTPRCANADNSAIESISPDKSKTLAVTWDDQSINYVGINFKGMFGGKQKRFDLGDVPTNSFDPNRVEVIWPRKGPYVILFIQSRLGDANYFADTRVDYPRLVKFAEPDWPTAATQAGLKPGSGDLDTPATATEASVSGNQMVTFEYDKIVGAKTLKYAVSYDLTKGGAVKTSAPINELAQKK
jgi:hypothetical protein